MRASSPAGEAIVDGTIQADFIDVQLGVHVVQGCLTGCGLRNSRSAIPTVGWG
jgi:hypothetical protein